MVFLLSLSQFALTRNVPAQSEFVYLPGNTIEDTFIEDPAKRNYSLAAWNYSFIGNYKKALESYDKWQAEQPKQQYVNAPVVTDLTNVFTFKPAKEFLIEKSRGHRVVIINEAHHQPMHRVFTESMLDDLYNIGFRYLGLEALAEDSLINIRKWPLVSDGYYTREPQFGNMIRKALQIGFRVFGYEAPEKRGVEREQGQAANIAKIFDQDPEARILIHCGFSHVIEESAEVSRRKMAGELKSITNIDPLTIDQVDLTERSSPEFEPPVFKSYSVDVPSVLLNSEGKILGENNHDPRVDVQVMHPRIQCIGGRPVWLLRNNMWKLLNTDQISISMKPPYLVSAYWNDETDTDRVPVDQIEVNGDNQFLILPPGEFQLVLRDSKENVEKVIYVNPVVPLPDH